MLGLISPGPPIELQNRVEKLNLVPSYLRLEIPGDFGG